MIILPRRSRLLTPLAGLLGLALFLWIRQEDVSLWPAAALGAAVSALAAAGLLLRYGGGRPHPPMRAALILGGAGLLAGLAAPALAVVLIAVKTGMHAHPQPDYPPEAVLGLLARAPAWALAGLLIGLAAALALFGLLARRH